MIIAQTSARLSLVPLGFQEASPNALLNLVTVEEMEVWRLASGRKLTCSDYSVITNMEQPPSRPFMSGTGRPAGLRRDLTRPA
jgi:hypothetical protein